MNFKEYLTWYRDVVDKEVEGWFYPIDIIVMYGILNDIQKEISGDVCEIGVAYGKSAITISNFKKTNDNFYLYDIFPEEVYAKCLSNIKKFGTDNNLIWRLEDTTQLNHKDGKLFENPIRFLHIDGCHEHSAVLGDLQFFSQYMLDQGVIVLDDFNDYEYPGVNSAAVEFSLAKYNVKNWRVFAIGDNKAYLCQKRFLPTYQSMLAMFMKSALKNMNVPFPLPLGLREMMDVNVLMCDSREDWDLNKIVQCVFDKPRIG